MKKIKNILIVAIVALSTFSCSLQESPKFPSSSILFSDIEGANTVLNGAYSGMAAFNYYGADFHHLTTGYSGMFSTNKDADLKNIYALNPGVSQNYVVNVWAQSYTIIERTNDVIAGIEAYGLEGAEADNIKGQALFIRSLVYFNLVRLYGKAILKLDPSTTQNIDQPMATKEDIYSSIIDDAEAAELLLPQASSTGRPTSYAADMLLAKVYMTLAGNQTAAETENWQKAYNHAIKVYGKFSLVSDYRTLWMDESSNHTSESIFEIDGNIENTLRLTQLFTASNGNIGRSVWGRVKAHIELYDTHTARYPTDPRLAETFVTEWVKFAANGKETIIKTYPIFKSRQNKDKSYPFTGKHYINNIYNSGYTTNKNFVVFRYADLLIMLAEIENELNGPTDAVGYINEVLARAEASTDDPAIVDEMAFSSSITQEQFREDIYWEYNYELLTEGHDWFNSRRRGFDWYVQHVIEVHNNHPSYIFTKSRDVELPVDSRAMLVPIPSTEIDSNPNVTPDDQNPGF